MAIKTCFTANGGIDMSMLTIDVMESDADNVQPPPKLIVRRAATDRAWRALWAWLLAPPDHDVVARDDTRNDYPQDPEEKTNLD